MVYERIRAEDKRLVLVVVVLLAGGGWYAMSHYREAFPQASIDLRYSKGEITQMAERFAAARGLSTEGFRGLTLFDPDESARLFLERELGLEDANRLMQGQVAVWRWRARWFRPPEKEEIVVYLTPGGRLAGFRHTVPEAAEGPRLEKAEALRRAAAFLREQSAANHRLVEEQLVQRPARYDYIFTWEQEGFRAKDATYRRKVVIQGDEVGEYAEYLHVPERWEREYAALRASNELYFGIAQALYLALILAAVVVLIRGAWRRQIRWRPLVVICGAAALLAAINQWNLLPFFIDGMPTSTSYRDMVLLGLLEGVGAGVGYFFYIIVGAAPGEPLYRGFQPQRLSLSAALSARGIRTREFWRATIVAYGFTGVHLAWLVAFYLVGRRFGAWAPQDVAYSDLLSTAIPWVYPLAIGVQASASEEFWFRMLAIPLLARYAGSRWVAVLAPALVWGFLHANYPQQPGFIRGVEIGVVGVAAGYLMLRYGILATLIWHYTYDAFLISTILFQSDSVYLRATGAAVSGAALIPLGVSLWSYRRHGGFVADPALLNMNVAAPETEAVPAGAEAVRAEPVLPRWRTRWLYLAAGTAVVAGILARPIRFGDFVRVRLSAAEAGSAADEALRGRGADPGAWRRSIGFVPNLSVADFEYIRRLEGARAANETVRDRTFTGVWFVRYFRPLEPEEWRVYILPEGKVYRIDHVLSETAPGAKLAPDEARRLAEAYLRESGLLPLERYRLVDTSTEKREKRTDHQFEWEDVEFQVGEAKARVSLAVVGDEVSGVRRYLKLPEAWLREFQRPRLQQYLIPALAGAFGLPLLVIFIRRLSGRETEDRHRHHWRFYALCAAGAAVLTAVNAANRWSTAFNSYNTAEPIENFVAQWLLGQVSAVLVSTFGVCLLVVAADVFLQMAAGHRRPSPPSVRRTVAVTGLLWGLERVFSAAVQALPGPRYDLPLWDIPGPANYLPALAAVAAGAYAVAAVFLPAVIAGAALWRFFRRRRMYVPAVVGVALAALGEASSLWLWLLQCGKWVGLVVLAYFLVKSCGLDFGAFGISMFWLGIISGSSALLAQPAAFLKWNGAAALLVGLASGVLILVWLRRQADAGVNV